MDEHEVFNDSYTRCNQDPRFFNIFYATFWRKDDKFRQMFANVDMSKQIKMLKASIAIIMLASNSEAASNSLRYFGRRHGPDGIGVHPIDFDIWLDCLLETVSTCDPYFNPGVKQAWQACFKLGIAIMKEEAQKSPRNTTP